MSAGNRVARKLMVIVVAVVAAAGPASAQERRAELAHPNATAAVQVTDDPNPVRAHVAPLTGINPRTGELVVVAIEGRTTKACSVHVSSDGGRRWFPGGKLTRDPHTDCGSDPVWSNNMWLTFDRDGTLYVAFIAHDPQFQLVGRDNFPRHVFLARSTDSGRSFQTSTVYEAREDGATRTNRLPQVAVDPRDTSRVYVSWQQGGFGPITKRAFVAASADGGQTFRDPVNAAESLGNGRTPRITVDGEGVVHVVIPLDDDGRPVHYRRSADQARTWSTPVELQRKDVLADGRRNRKWRLQADPNSPRLYFVFYGTVNPSAKVQDSTNDIFLQVSPDGGKTWNAPLIVNDDLPGVQQYDPNISVAPNGRLDIAWLDFRNSPYPEHDSPVSPWNNGGYQDVYYSYSTDGGKTLSPNSRVTDRVINREIGVWSNRVHMHGHVGIASANDTVYFAWQDTRNGDAMNEAEDVYFASYLFNESRARVADTSDGAPVAMVAGTALVLGMGLAMVMSWLLIRRRSRPPAS